MALVFGAQPLEPFREPLAVGGVELAQHGLAHRLHRLRARCRHAQVGKVARRVLAPHRHRLGRGRHVHADADAHAARMLLERYADYLLQLIRGNRLLVAERTARVALMDAIRGKGRGSILRYATRAWSAERAIRASRSARAGEADVVRPLDLDALGSAHGNQASQGAADGHGHGQAERRQLGRRHLGAQQHGQVHAAPRARPRAPLAPVAPALGVGRHREPFRLACLERLLHHLVGGRHLAEALQAEAAHSLHARPTLWSSGTESTGTPLASTWCGSSSSSGFTTKSRSVTRGCGSVRSSVEKS